jgi:hypothetical protein
MKYFLCKYIPRRGDFLATIDADERESIECLKTALSVPAWGQHRDRRERSPEPAKSRESFEDNATRNYLNPSGI